VGQGMGEAADSFIVGRPAVTSIAIDYGLTFPVLPNGGPVEAREKQLIHRLLDLHTVACVMEPSPSAESCRIRSDASSQGHKRASVYPHAIESPDC